MHCHVKGDVCRDRGSVVTHDLPSNVVAVGTPCKVLREVGEHDREYYFKEYKIDWEHMEE